MFGIKMLSNFVASVAVEIRAAIEVGVPVDDAAMGVPRTDERGPTIALSGDEQWEHARGRMTRNGRGSLEIGAGKTRVNE